MLLATTKGSICVKLFIEQADAPLDSTAPCLEKLFLLRRVDGLLPVAACRRDDLDALLEQGFALLGIRPIAVVRQKTTGERRREERIQPLRVVAVARHLKNEGDTASGCEGQVLSNSVKPPLQRGAVAATGQAGEAFLLAGTDRPADIDRMRVEDGKGGDSSPARVQKAELSRSISGVNNARRSAQFGRDKRRGNNPHITGLLSNHR